jgi:hypothetical protein
MAKSTDTPKFKELTRETAIPLYGFHFILSVSRDIHKSISKYSHLFGDDIPEDVCAGGMCVSSDGAFALFFDIEYLNHGVIAHEIFHACHDILRFTGEEYHEENQEPYAYLCQWITDWVYKNIKKAKISLQ